VNTVSGVKKKPLGPTSGLSLEHYFRLFIHRWWLVAGTFLAVTASTSLVVWRLPNLYSSDTLILVDPQKVPESYVRSTVTGDVRSRLGTLEQQILSSTRLQTIIDSLKLYPEDRKKLAREEIISKMRKDIEVKLLSDFGASQDLQAFRISYSGRDPRLVARVANELAQLFIAENLKAREQQATGTTEFLENQLQSTRKDLEIQEGKLRDFRLKHIGEMPEQQAATLQILGNLQAQLQLESEALSRAEQQRSTLLAMMSQSTPLLDLDDIGSKGPVIDRTDRPPSAGVSKASAAPGAKAKLMAALADQLNRGHLESHPEVRKLKAQLAEEEAKEKAATAVSAPANTVDANTTEEPPLPALPTRKVPPPRVSSNPVLQSQLKSSEEEIAKHNQEQQRLSQLVGSYQSKLEAIPLREQQIANLVRDYDISKAHYGGLLDRQLSAETATQLEIRQKGEKFSILDPAQPAGSPSKPNRLLLDAGGAGAGLGLGLLLALLSELFGTSIITAAQITEMTDIPVLEVIPVIRTEADRTRNRRRLLLAMVSGTLMTLVAGGLVLIHYHRQWF
jgi:polysaccharide chain length determinant protein (PEP-CTERM system associated)